MNNKINSLQALRGMAFLGIFLAHAESSIEWAAFGVSVFFVMSGFLMTYVYINRELEVSFKSSIQFSINKIKKLYPLHIITMCCQIILAIIIMVNNYRGISDIFKLLVKIIMNIFLVQTWIPAEGINMSLNGVAWYLSVTLVLYFLFPFILRSIKKVKKTSNLVSIGVSIWILQYIIAVVGLILNKYKGDFFVWVTYDCPIYRLGDFIIGCITAYIFINSSKKTMSTVKSSILEFVSLAAIILVILWGKQEPTNIYIRAISKNWTILYIPLAVITILLFIYNNGIITKLLNNKALVYLGDISPYTFLIHFVITKSVNRLTEYLQITPDTITRICIIIAEFILTITLTIIYLNISNIIKNKRGA